MDEKVQENKRERERDLGELRLGRTEAWGFDPCIYVCIYYVLGILKS